MEFDLFMEIVAFAASAFCSYKFLKELLYELASGGKTPDRSKHTAYVPICFTIIAFVIILYTLLTLASFDVVKDLVYIIFYIVMGFAWLYLGLLLMSILFDLSWIDDAINLNNKAALVSIAGGFLSLTIIYAGANIGDGPGWWCVVFAGGLGLAAWTLLALVINAVTKVFERVTVERDLYCGIRLGSYFLASGIILGRASGGDWTSFFMTIVEFGVGWPVLPLAALMILIERYYINKSKLETYEQRNYLTGSILFGTFYMAIAVVSVLYLPPII